MPNLRCTLTYLFNQKKTHHLPGNHQWNHDSFLVRDDHLSIFLQFIAGLCYQMHHLQGHHNTNPVTWKKTGRVLRQVVFANDESLVGLIYVDMLPRENLADKCWIDWKEKMSIASLQPLWLLKLQTLLLGGYNCPMSHETTSHSLFGQTGQQLTYTNQVSQASAAWRSNQRSSSELKYPRPLFQWYSEPRCNTTWAFAVSCTPPPRRKKQWWDKVIHPKLGFHWHPWRF